MYNASHLPRRSRIITSVNLTTIDPIVNPQVFWYMRLFIPDKPCSIVSSRCKLHLRTDMARNYDSTAVPTIPYNGSCSASFCIYKDTPNTYGAPLLPDPSNEGIWWPYNNTELLDYGWLHVDTPPPITPLVLKWTTQPNPQTITGVGDITGPIAAPAGTGAVGPLVVNLASTYTMTGVNESRLFGGTTVSVYNNKEYQYMRMDKSDLIVLSGRFTYGNNINVGGKLEGTVEFDVQY